MNNDSRLEEVRQRLLRPASVEDVRGTLPVLDVMLTSPELAKQATELIRQAFVCLRQLTTSEPIQSIEILINELLSRCLVPDRGDENKYGLRLSHIFGEWLNDLPEDHRRRARSVALPWALESLLGNGVRNAIRLISSIGYWDNDVVAALDRLARDRDDETGDHAQSARVTLKSELERPVRELFLDRLHGRIPAGPNLHQISCARIIGNLETAELAWSNWLAPITPEGSERNLLASFAMSLLAEIAARERNVEFTVRVWNWLVELSRRSTRALDDVFSPNSSLINRLDIPEVVPELVRLAIRAEGYHRYLYYLRVLECKRPAHMAGWDAITPAELELVRVDAVEPTRMVGRFTTTELRQKEAAWDVLLCRGQSAVLPPFGDALADENGYVVHRILQLGACLSLDPLPQALRTLLAGAEGQNWDDNERLIAQIGAIEATRGAGTREAFDALLGYRQLGEGVLLSLVEALAETALLLKEVGDRSAIELLLQIAETSPREDSRGAASAAVAALLEEAALNSTEIERASALLQLPETDPYARNELLLALATLSPADVPTTALEYATRALNAPVVEGGHDPRHAALTVVARQPGFRSDPDFQDRYLGLTNDGESLVTSEDTFKGVVPHVVGRYFVAEPERFGPAVASLLRDGNTSALAHVLPSVREVGRESPEVVLNALVARLRRADSGTVAEPSVLHTLAIVAPDRLFSNACTNLAAWLPELRADLADTLGGVGELPDRQAEARFELLSRLVGDGIYAVRRSAYRAAAQCDINQLRLLAVTWRWPEQLGPRWYAAECAGWLPSELDPHFAELAWDQEPVVREAYKRSMGERAERLAAAEFEKKVLEVSDSVGVIRAWRHGIGLSEVGDDSTIRRLSDRLLDGLPASVRFWLKRVRNAVERRWSAVTQKWPEPWHARPGHLEKFTGILQRNGKKVMVSGTLWLMPAEAPGGRLSWGGWATSDSRWMGDDGELLIEGRRAATLLINNSFFPVTEFVFWGNGLYPYPVNDVDE